LLRTIIVSNAPVSITAADLALMRRAIGLARDAIGKPGTSPIGCVIVADGRIIAEGWNEVEHEHDPTAHAEIVTIRRACAAIGRSDLRAATMYTTLQPCGMCTMASIWAKLGRIVYGAERHQVHKMYFEDRHLQITDFIKDAFKEDIELCGGVLGSECAFLYVGPDEHVPARDRVNL
jgi:tRNA(adenine34) deaminase